MTVTAPSPAEFLTAPPEPDEEEENPALDYVEGPHWKPAQQTPTADPLATAPRDSLASIAASLEAIAHTLAQPDRTVELQQNLDEIEADLHEQLRAQGEELAAAKAQLEETVAEVLGIVKKSTSKLADQIRAALQGARAAEPAPEPVTPEPVVGSGNPAVLEQPAHDADVEEWRAYARSRGFVPDLANRSQIRTMLGIPQPVVAEGGGQ